MPRGQKPYIPQSRRDIIPRAGRTPFGKDKAPSTADLEPRAPRPVKAAPSTAVKQVPEAPVSRFNRAEQLRRMEEQVMGRQRDAQSTDKYNSNGT